MDGEELGGLIAWTMDLYDNGIITKEDLGGIDLTWGNLDATLQFMKAVAYREGKAANAIADGFRRAYEVFGDESIWYAAETHGCAIDTQDMRFAKGNITRYCCSHMGARKHGDENSPLYEALTMCSFWAGNIGTIWGSRNDGLANWINATTGWNVTADDVEDFRKRNDFFSRAVSHKQGYNPLVDTTVSERFFTEKPVSKYGTAHGFDQAEFDAAVKKYWVEVRGVSEQGLMLKSELERLGLDFIIPVLEPMGQLA
jgi:aldehyde:ferredoxin oxidoreductase